LRVEGDAADQVVRRVERQIPIEPDAAPAYVPQYPTTELVDPGCAEKPPVKPVGFVNVPDSTQLEYVPVNA
jgi:hypothetical protein